jgi:hypothetical protein
MVPLVAIALGAAACSSGPPAAVTPTQSVTTSAGVTVGIRASSSFAQAKKKWLHAATVSSAEQGLYWRAAATALEKGIKMAGANAPRYRSAIRALENLASLPDANDTPKQMAESRHDISVLDYFFGTADPYD